MLQTHVSRTDVVSDVKPLVRLLRGRRTVVLAGAGCSTESGIPDYRGPEGRLRVRKPVQYGDFVRSADVRARYWARSTVGWARVSSAEPNASHHGLARLEGSGHVVGVITQNVDGLHHAAGSRSVIELHGSLAQVICLSCGDRTPREEIQDRMVQRNGGWMDRIATSAGETGHEAAPDGDAVLPDRVYAEFESPACGRCGGILKPDVVFFGENVPRERVSACWRMLDDADCLLVVGSSLTVFSGRRFVYGAVEREIPVGVVNLGPTRADEVAAAKVEGRAGHVIPLLAESLERG